MKKHYSPINLHLCVVFKTVELSLVHFPDCTSQPHDPEQLQDFEQFWP